MKDTREILVIQGTKRFLWTTKKYWDVYAIDKFLGMGRKLGTFPTELQAHKNAVHWQYEFGLSKTNTP